MYNKFLLFQNHIFWQTFRIFSINAKYEQNRRKKQSVSMALYFECRINKNTLFQSKKPIDYVLQFSYNKENPC